MKRRPVVRAVTFGEERESNDQNQQKTKEATHGPAV